MARINGEDHRVLAELLDYRVGELEKVTEANGQIAAAVRTDVAIIGTKIDTLIDLHEGVSRRLDDHLEAHAKAPATPVAPPSTAVWKSPTWLFAAATLVASWAGAAYVAGKTATEQFVDWLTHLGG